MSPFFLRIPAAATVLAVAACSFSSCQHVAQATSGALAGAGLAADGTNTGPGVVRPVVVTQPVRYDTDDPAIWVNAQDPAQSLVIGTDKDSDGGLYVFDLQGKEVLTKTVHGLKRPNNVDLAYGLKLGGKPTDFALVTERETGLLRAYRLPGMQPLDHGNLAVFAGAPAEERMPMGVAIYTRPADGATFAVVGRKTGPREGYLAQYRLADDGAGQLTMTLVRTFGTWSGKKEIESIAVDNELGFIYYSDEGVACASTTPTPPRATPSWRSLPAPALPRTTRVFPFTKPARKPAISSCRTRARASSASSPAKALLPTPTLTPSCALCPWPPTSATAPTSPTYP